MSLGQQLTLSNPQSAASRASSLLGTKPGACAPGFTLSCAPRTVVEWAHEPTQLLRYHWWGRRGAVPERSVSSRIRRTVERRAPQGAAASDREAFRQSNTSGKFDSWPANLSRTQSGLRCDPATAEVRG